MTALAKAGAKKIEGYARWRCVALVWLCLAGPWRLAAAMDSQLPGGERHDAAYKIPVAEFIRGKHPHHCLFLPCLATRGFTRQVITQ